MKAEPRPCPDDFLPDIKLSTQFGKPRWYYFSEVPKLEMFKPVADSWADNNQQRAEFRQEIWDMLEQCRINLEAAAAEPPGLLQLVPAGNEGLVWQNRQLKNLLVAEQARTHDLVAQFLATPPLLNRDAMAQRTVVSTGTILTVPMTQQQKENIIVQAFDLADMFLREREKRLTAALVAGAEQQA